MLASIKGHTSTVKMLAFELEADVEARDENNLTALHLAIFIGFTNIVSLLIDEFGCNPHSTNLEISIPLNVPCTDGQVLTKLDISRPLHLACLGGQVDMITKLVDEYKCDPRARGVNGYTTLHVAAECGRDDIVRVLIKKYNCLVDCVNSNGCTPLMSAAHQGRASTVKLLASVFGAGVEVRDNTNLTVLHYAVFAGHNSVVSVLIEECSCNPNIRG